MSCTVRKYIHWSARQLTLQLGVHRRRHAPGKGLAAPQASQARPPGGCHAGARPCGYWYLDFAEAEGAVPAICTVACNSSAEMPASRISAGAGAAHGCSAKLHCATGRPRHGGNHVFSGLVRAHVHVHIARRHQRTPTAAPACCRWPATGRRRAPATARPPAKIQPNWALALC